VLPEKFTQGGAHATDEVIGADIGQAPVPARAVSLFVLQDHLLLERDEENHHGLRGGQEIQGHHVLAISDLGKTVESVVDLRTHHERFLPPPLFAYSAGFIFNKPLQELPESLYHDSTVSGSQSPASLGKEGMADLNLILFSLQERTLTSDSHEGFWMRW
jgi:hypothetical protein